MLSGADAMGAEAHGRRGLCPHDHAGSCPRSSSGAGFTPRGRKRKSPSSSPLVAHRTAEIPGDYHANGVIDENKLPLKYVDYRIVSAPSRHVRSRTYDLIVHQFSKSSFIFTARGSQRRCMRSCVFGRNGVQKLG